MQGFNMGRYYPPDASNAPQFNTPLTRKTAPTVRFELPFAVWCTHCTPHAIVGQGVRFNAQKTKVGNYHSTPIWSFRMKHTVCGGWWEIRTDPKAAEYIVIEGARRREYGCEVEGEGELKFLTAEEREKRRSDAMAGLEGRVEEKEVVDQARRRVEELYAGSEVWRDNYDVNARLRKGFRVQRKVLEKEERGNEKLRERFSLGMEVLAESEGDGVRAGLVDFGKRTGEESVEVVVGRRGLFEENGTIEDEKAEDKQHKRGKVLKAEIKARKSRKDLQKNLIGNSRAVVDPFLSSDVRATQKLNLGILKRKRDGEDGIPSPAISSTISNAQDGLDSRTLEAATSTDTQNREKESPVAPAAKKPALLIEYDSD